ncbi:MAG TPA: hypothetical protein VLF40_02850, partial [Candidatus Saccharimonadales bacterium]|nr:hypothetical protein [Candidatus Saccharimonadales bacterium]
MHLGTLHTQAHMPQSPYKPHSDGAPYGKEYMDVARAVTGDHHYIAENMSDSGHWVNFRSLFGDTGFWAVTREQFPAIFNRAVDHLLGLPQDFQQKSMYLEHKATINPIALIRDHYPDAYQQITEARPDFVTDGKVAMRIRFSEREMPRGRDGRFLSHDHTHEIAPGGKEYIFIVEH